MPVRSTPLSQDESPGPSHYTPLLTLVSPSTPKFSMLGRDSIAALPHTLPYPSPADRDIRLDPLRVGTKFASQKGKGTTWPYATRKNPHITPSPGPNINLHHNDVGTSEQRASISSRNMSGVLLGHPGTFAQPVDSHGFQTPGPAVYTPHPLDSLSGLKQSIGRKLAGESSETCVPGAGTYEIASSFDSTAGHCFGGHLQALTMDTKPAPNSYCLPSTNNKNISYSLRARNEPVLRIITPAPNRYQLSSVDDTGGKYSRCAGLQYRAFEPELARAPTAASYDNSCCPFAIDSSPIHASRCPPGYPDVLHYPEFCTLSTPSPAAYHPSISITRPLDPCYSFGSPFSHPISLIPSPNKYDTRGVKTSRHAHTCSYSIRPKTVGVSADNSAMLPGPSDYSPKEAKRSAPVHSFGVKHSHTDKLDPTSPSPSPTSYHIPNNLTHRGIMQSPSYSFKGMLSPRVYNGFSNSSILAKLSTIC